MDNDVYIHELESRHELMSERVTTLETEKEEAIQSLKRHQDYLKDVIYCLADKVEETDRWQLLQDISKIGKKPIYHDNQKADLIVALVGQKLGFRTK